jgi:hypothetical protein
VTVVFASHKSDFRADAHARTHVISTGAAQEAFSHHPVVGEEEATGCEFDRHFLLDLGGGRRG